MPIGVNRRVDPEFVSEVEKYAKPLRMSFGQFIVIHYPRCPNCGGLLIQKFGSKLLQCVNCKLEYALITVNGNGIELEDSICRNCIYKNKCSEYCTAFRIVQHLCRRNINLLIKLI